MTECRKAETNLRSLDFFGNTIVNRSCPLALLILSWRDASKGEWVSERERKETIAYNRLECGCGQCASFPFPLPFPSHSPLSLPPFRFPLPATTRLYRVKTHKRFLSSLRFWKQSNNRKLDEAAGEEGSQEEPRKKQQKRDGELPSVFGHWTVRPKRGPRAERVLSEERRRRSMLVLTVKSRRIVRSCSLYPLPYPLPYPAVPVTALESQPDLGLYSEIGLMPSRLIKAEGTSKKGSA